MKKLLLFFCLIFNLSNLCGQDLILTEENKLMIVEIVRMDSQMTFYKHKGKSEMQVIFNNKIKFYNWNARNTFTQGYESYRYKRKIVTLDMSGNWVVLERAYSALPRNLAIISGSLSGALLIAASNSSDLASGLTLLAGSAGFLVVSVICGMVHVVLKSFNKNQYRLKNTVNPLGFDKHVKLPSKEKSLVYFSPAKSGLGIQLNF